MAGTFIAARNERAGAPDGRKAKRAAYELRLKIMLPFLIVAVCLLYSFTSEVVPSESMAPTLKPGDHILTMKSWLAYPRGATPERGDIVVFNLKDNDGKPEASANTSSGVQGLRERLRELRHRGDVLVKRVVGLPGETIQIRFDGIYINGRRLPQPYEGNAIGDYGVDGPLKLGVDEIFLLGDNASVSDDSRSWGPIPCSEVVGKCVGVWFHSSIGISRAKEDSAHP